MARRLVNKTSSNRLINPESTPTPQAASTDNTSTTGEIISLIKKAYNKNQYEKVIDTKFSQLATTVSPSEQLSSPTISVEEFFQNYEQIFLQIPKEGETNSHEYLVKTSSEYINSDTLNSDIQALIDEINILQQQNLDLNQQIIELQLTGSLSTDINAAREANTTQTQIATRGRG
jgi:hypothetical protein